MSQSEMPEWFHCSDDTAVFGIDSKTACRVEVLVRSYVAIIEGRREYKKGRTVGWVVDSKEYSLVELQKDMTEYYTWGDSQRPNFWYAGGQTVRIHNDNELLGFLRASTKVTLVMCIDNVRHGGTDDDLHVSEGGVESSDCWAVVPLYGDTVAGPDRVEELEKDHYMDSGVDPEGDEPTGVDEEWRYFENKKCKQKVKKDLVEEELGDIADFDPQSVPDDEANIIDNVFTAHTSYDRDNPVIEKRSIFVDKKAFILVIKQYAIMKEFETTITHSDPNRYRAKCLATDCDWNVYAKRLHGGTTFMVVNIGPEHTCASTSRLKGKEASKAWIAEKGKEILRKEPTIGARELQKRLEQHFNIDLQYNRVWAGRQAALEDLHGTWEDSFRLLWNFKAALEKTCPGSVVEIDCKKVAGQMHFSRMFIAIRSCVDGFLVGCRPYLGVDSTHLTGKYNGQLAAATSIDGHNWMYPVAYAIFDKETNSNWAWFMTQLKKAIGTPSGLTIHTDACKGLDHAVLKVFGGTVEHRECFRHLMMNFRKKFKGDVLRYMWPCAWACKPERYNRIFEKIAQTCPEAITYLQTHHKHLWSRSTFSRTCKVDYVNNISECFNSWIKDFKELPVVDLVDKIREMIQQKIATRQEIANRMKGSILPSVIHELHMKSRGLKYNIGKSGHMKAEISRPSRDGSTWRYGVDLLKHSCSCGHWEISGKPCTHAIAYITHLRQVKVEYYVDDYYSVQRFKECYRFDLNPMDDKSQWPGLNPGFHMNPPKLERSAGRPRKKRFKQSGEPGKRGPYQCKKCFQFGHIEKGCPNVRIEPDEDLPQPPIRKSRKRKTPHQPGSTSSPQTRHRAAAAGSPSTPLTRKRAAAAGSPSTPLTRQRAAAAGSPSTPLTRQRAAAAGSPSTPLTRQRAAAAGSPSTRQRVAPMQDLQ